MQIPFNFKPRDYQLPLLQAIDSGYKRLLCVWHRRAGKDKTLINIVAKKMFEKVGAYYYFFPTYNQGKKILWNGIDKEGFKFLDHIPQSVRRRTDKGEMLIETINGSIFQIVGTDNVDSIVGTNPVGCVFSEYALQDPIAWGYIRPILLENGGWAIFNYTSRGRNHGYTLLQYAKKEKDWFISILPATETTVFTPEQLESERLQYISEDGDDLRYRQEYLCSFDGAVQGSYYGKIIQELDDANCVRDFPIEDTIKVNTYWDLGVGDSTVIWFTQEVANEIRVIDYYETNGEGLAHYFKILQDKRYIYKDHYAPHDIQVRELGTGVSRLETARKLGINFRIVPMLSLDDGIQASRIILRKCIFHKTNCERGLDALRNYHKEYDDKNKTFKDRPCHDWSSHGADAFRSLAVGYKEATKPYVKKVYQPTNSITGY
jgi:phage terminase large subunit